MATQLTVPGLIVKWLVVPAAMVGTGYFLIGSRIGAGSLKPTTEQDSKVQALVTSTPDSKISPAPITPPVVVSHPKPRRKHVVHHKKHVVKNPEDSVTPPSDANFPQVQPPSTDSGSGGPEPSGDSGTDGTAGTGVGTTAVAFRENV